MSKRSEHLLASLLGADYNATSNPAAAATCVVTLTCPNPKSRVTLTNLLLNETNVTAADHTAVVSIRDASIAGTVLGQHQMIVRFGGYDGLAAPMFLSGNLGNNVVIEFGTPAASVTQKITACYFVDDQRKA